MEELAAPLEGRTILSPLGARYGISGFFCDVGLFFHSEDLAAAFAEPLAAIYKAAGFVMAAVRTSVLAGCIRPVTKMLD
jgi:hypothetical protein